MSLTLRTSPILSDQGLRTVIGTIQSVLVDQIFNSGALAIGSSSKPKVKIVSTVYALIGAVVVKKTTAEVVISGTVTNAKFNVYVLSMDAAGTVTATMGTEGATLGAVVLPATPTGNVVLGFVIVNPTGTGSFVGGTTDLDDATVVPNAVYVNTVGPFQPNLTNL